jgi:hypothetical protein
MVNLPLASVELLPYHKMQTATELLLEILEESSGNRPQ